MQLVLLEYAKHSQDDLLKEKAAELFIMLWKRAGQNDGGCCTSSTRLATAGSIRA
jgi:hypothetical protein